jgi:hypothetical protein
MFLVEVQHCIRLAHIKAQSIYSCERLRFSKHHGVLTFWVDCIFERWGGGALTESESTYFSYLCETVDIVRVYLYHPSDCNRHYPAFICVISSKELSRDRWKLWLLRGEGADSELGTQRDIEWMRRGSVRLQRLQRPIATYRQSIVTHKAVHVLANPLSSPLYVCFSRRRSLPFCTVEE